MGILLPECACPAAEGRVLATVRPTGDQPAARCEDSIPAAPRPAAPARPFRSADAEDRRPVPLDQGCEGRLGCLAVLGREPFEELTVG
jgi:hypothetical protein